MKAARLLRTFATDPVRVGRALPGEVQQWYRSRHAAPSYAAADVDPAWSQRLLNLLPGAGPEAPDGADGCDGAGAGADGGDGLDEVMADIGRLLAGRGLRSGRATYAYYSDAETSLCRAVWAVVLRTRPEVVIETGVAHGVTSRVVLEALARTNAGHLYSIDLPFPFDHRLHAETGVAVTDSLRPRWTYLAGSSRDRLPPLIPEVGHVDLFIHDSLHTARNTMFEMETVAAALSPGGVMIVDDIGSHNGFTLFARRHPDYQTIICPSADQVGIFGIAIRPR